MTGFIWNNFQPIQFLLLKSIKKAVHFVSLCKPTLSAVGRRPKVEAFFDLRNEVKVVAKVCCISPLLATESGSMKKLPEGIEDFS